MHRCRREPIPLVAAEAVVGWDKAGSAAAARLSSTLRLRPEGSSPKSGPPFEGCQARGSGGPSLALRACPTLRFEKHVFSRAKILHGVAWHPAFPFVGHSVAVRVDGGRAAFQIWPSADLVLRIDQPVGPIPNLVHEPFVRCIAADSTGLWSTKSERSSPGPPLRPRSALGGKEARIQSALRSDSRSVATRMLT